MREMWEVLYIDIDIFLLAQTLDKFLAFDKSSL